MSFLALNLLLAIIWMFLFGAFSLPSFVVGFIAGYLAILFMRPVLGAERYIRAIWGVLKLAVGFAREMVLANLHLARDILRPVPPFKPGFITFDAGALPPAATVILGNLVSLTPGTLSVDMEEDGSLLYIHALYAEDPEQVRADVRRLAELVHGALGADGPLYPAEEGR